MDDESAEGHELNRFAEIVNASLNDVGRPVHLRIMDWSICVAMLLAIGLGLAFLIGSCIIIWHLALG